MKNKLFVSNIDFEVTTEQLQELFSKVGTCKSAVIATDRETKRSKGFAFIEMDSAEDAAKAIEKLDGETLNGRTIKVSYDRGKTGDVVKSVLKGKKSDGPGGHRHRHALPPIQRMQLFKRHKKLDPFMADPTKTIDWRDAATLSRFVSERGRILSRRMTGLSAYNQRKVAKAIKRAQSLGLMPYAR